MYKQFDKLRDRFLKKFSFTLLVTLVYIGLNLDRSIITLTHLLRLFKDGILSVPYRIHKIIPPEIKPEKLRRHIKRGLANFKVNKIRILAMTLFKRLDLGNPVVPDLRLLSDNYLKELCLPKDLSPLVLSLMHYKPTNLDVNAKDLLVYKMPHYELQVMTYILWALKLCLGLDGFYEVKLSGAVEAINKEEERVKSHFVYGESPPTDRLFSFREWVTFYQFRQIMLRYYVHRLAYKTSWDTDDYIALEHHMDLFDSEHDKNLRDEMTHDLINRINGGEVETHLIPRSEFMHTVTPFHDYTQVIIQHIKDPEVKLRLSEDFRSYSLKYVTTDWNLVHPRSTTKRNLVKGIRSSNKHVSNESLNRKLVKHNHRKVYVRDCDNPNWLTTKPPTSEHVVEVDEVDDSDDEPIIKYVTKNKLFENGEINLEDTKINDDKLVEENIFINGVDKSLNKYNERAEFKEGFESKSHSISEVSMTNTSFSSRLQFEDYNDIAESKLNAAEKDMLNKLSDSIASNSKFPDFVSEHSFTDTTLSNSIVNVNETKVFGSGKLDESEITKLKEMNKNLLIDKIREETEGVNIFDDDFKPDIKEEIIEPNTEMDYENTFQCEAPGAVYNSLQDVPLNQSERNKENDSVSQCSSLDSVNFNEKTFDRAKAIKELIIHMCKKHKLPLPAEYNPRPRAVNGARKEMGMFSVVAGQRETVKLTRDYALEKSRRGLLTDLIADYHSAAREDILNKLAQSVTTAIENALKENVANTSTQDAQHTPDENLETNAMEVDNISNHSDVNDEPEEVTDLQKENENASDEEKLFSEESDGETHAKELLPEVNPNFDKEIYDADQLYLETAETVDEGEIELDPELSKIIEKKMAKDAKDPTLLTWTEERKKLERPDSEDEMPLSVLQDLQTLKKKLSQQETASLSPFLNHKVEKFKYWLKFLPLHDLGAYGRRFDKKLYNELPKSFTFVLKECAFVLGVKEGELYRNLQAFELSTIERLPNIKHDKRLCFKKNRKYE